MPKPLSQHRKYVGRPAWDDVIKQRRFKPENGKRYRVRLIGDSETVMRHWANTPTGGAFTLLCPKYNIPGEDLSLPHVCDMHDVFQDYGQRLILVNAIVREYQKSEDPDGGLRVIEFPTSLIEQITTITDAIGCELTDPENGWDILVSYDKKIQGPQKWTLTSTPTKTASGNGPSPLKDSEHPDSPKCVLPWVNFADAVPDFHGLRTDIPPGEAKKYQKEAYERAEQYSREMHTELARAGYFLNQEHPRVDPRNPYLAFKGDPDGKPFFEFQDLVEYELAKNGKRVNLVKRVLGIKDSSQLSRESDSPTETEERQSKTRVVVEDDGG